MPGPRPLAVPALLLAGAGVALGLLGAHALRLEGDLARRRARARAEDAVRDAAALLPTRLARGDGASDGGFRLVAPDPAFAAARAALDPATAVLVDQALFLEARGRPGEAFDLWTRLASQPAARGPVADAAALHATAAALRRPGGGAPPPPPAPARGVSADGLPLAAWAAYLRLAVAVAGRAPGPDLARAVEALLATPSAAEVRLDGGPDGADLLRRAMDGLGDAAARLPPATAAALRDRVARADAAHRALPRLRRAPLATVAGASADGRDDLVAAKALDDPTTVRWVAIARLAEGEAPPLPPGLAATTRAETIPADAARAQAPAPLDGLYVHARPDVGPLGGAGPWVLLGTGLAVYAAAAVATLVGLARARRAQRMKDDFMAAVSHEMKTPIAGVRAMAELLAAAPGDPARVERYAGRIEAEMARLGATVRDVLDAARIERDPTTTIRPRNAAPADVVKEVVAVARPALERRGFTVEADVAPAPDGPFRLDPDALAHVLHNLLDNAAKFAAERREVAVRAGPVPGGYRIEVLDRGPGVPPAERARVFERFVRGEDARARAVPGVGLGLHVARALVAAHGGTIGVGDRPGGGAAFVVELPAAGAADEGPRRRGRGRPA